MQHPLRCFRGLVAYDGARYAGWQTQSDQPSVQQTIEEALARICKERVRVRASGRTDAGVHAWAQSISFHARSRLTAERLGQALQGNVPRDIAILELKETRDDFDALNDAVGKRYGYWIQDGSRTDVFLAKFAWRVPVELDVAAMQQAAAHFIGEHDFCSFEASGSPRRSSVRTVRDLTVERRKTPWSLPHVLPPIVVEIEANGFLYNMVRNIVGTLVEIGKGKQTPAWAAQVLQAEDRKQAGPTAPPEGLFLQQVEYNDSNQ